MKLIFKLIIAANKNGWKLKIEGKEFNLIFEPTKPSIKYSKQELKQLLLEKER